MNSLRIRSFLFFLTILACIRISCIGQVVSENSNYPIHLTIGDSVIKAEAETASDNFNPKEDRVYYWYSSNMIHATQGSFEGKLLHGTYSSFYLNGNLKTKGKFRDGLQDGTWTEWYSNGLTQNRYSCREGQMQGSYFHYADDGNLLYKTRYSKNQLNGKYIEYNHGVQVSIQKFHHGSLVINQNSNKHSLFKRTDDKIKSLFKKKDNKQ